MANTEGIIIKALFEVTVKVYNWKIHITDVRKETTMTQRNILYSL